VVTNQARCLLTRRARSTSRHPRGGFSLIDLLVSIAVVAVLIALMMPTLSTVREAARRVVCASNVRQIGLGLAMYADDYKGMLPFTKFAGAGVGSGATALQSMVILRDSPQVWDGLGILFESDYLDAAGVFYCPSHHGDHPYSAYAQAWIEDSGRIVGNFQFRGVGAMNLSSFRDAQAMVADGMRVQSDYNHRVGSNVLRTDLTVAWFADPGGTLAARLPLSEADPAAANKVDDAWQTIDSGGRTAH
jgi:hypothetical protein